MLIIKDLHQIISDNVVILCLLCGKRLQEVVELAKTIQYTVDVQCENSDGVKFCEIQSIFLRFKVIWDSNVKIQSLACRSLTRIPC